jgi:trehalose/maltose hydrolase-like predicted phosphorylase
VTHHGNLFLLGNGRMGYRGTLEEFGPEEKVGIHLPGLYDRVGDAWREPVNAPNGLYTRVAVNGTWLNPLEVAPVGHRQSLDMGAAVHHRETKFLVEGAEVTIKAERFLSAADVNLMALRYTASVSGDAEITLESGIDERIWDLNGPHLDNLSVSHLDDAVVLTARTHEKGSEVAVAECCGLTASAPAQSSSVNGALRRWTFRVAGGATFELLKYAAVVSSLDACTLFNITDVFTNRPMRTYFRDKQVHISGDVAWAVWKYVQTTGDTGLLRDGGWEVMRSMSGPSTSGARIRPQMAGRGWSQPRASAASGSARRGSSSNPASRKNGNRHRSASCSAAMF